MFSAKEKIKKSNNLFWRKNQWKNRAASEVVGTLLLVTIAVSLFALLAIVTFTMPSIFFSDPTPSTNIVGRVEGNTVVFEHYGGRPLPLDTKITVMFAETPMIMTVGDILDSAAKADGEWNIGEKIVIVNNDPNLPIMLINAIIRDTASNTVVMRGVIQEGSQAVNPIAVTLHADSISTNTICSMTFDTILVQEKYVLNISRLLYTSRIIALLGIQLAGYRCLIAMDHIISIWLVYMKIQSISIKPGFNIIRLQMQL
jgi:FlaG/FlaF family flagellin (archaellin)